MSFLDEFDRRVRQSPGQEPAPRPPENVTDEDRELLEFADLIRAKQALPSAEEQARLRERIRAAEARGAHARRAVSPWRWAAWSAAAALLLCWALFRLFGSGLQVTPGPVVSRDGPTPPPGQLQGGGGVTPTGGPRVTNAASPGGRDAGEFAGIEFPKPVVLEGQGAEAVEAESVRDAARCLRVHGLAMIQAQGQKQWRVLQRGAAIRAGDAVRTSRRVQSSVRLLSPDGTALSLGPGAAVRFQGPRAWFHGEGNVQYEVAHRPDLEPFTVTTPQGQARALGTQFSLEVSPGQDPQNGATVLWVEDGRVAFGEKGKQEQEVAAGQSRVLQRGDVAAGSKKLTKDWLDGLTAELSRDHGIGQLVAQAEKAAEKMPLEIRRYAVSVRAVDGVARTYVEMAFFNNTDRRMEGTFYYPLPADATISEFSMWVGDQLMEGEVVEQMKARQVFEYIVRQQRDPALLEFAGGNLFKMRVFPIEPHSEKRIQLGYTQSLARRGGQVTYTFPLYSEMLLRNPLLELTLQFEAYSSTGLAELKSPTHRCASRLSDDRKAGALAFRAKKYSPSSDFTVTYEVANAPECAAFAHQRTDEDAGYFMLQLAPQIPLAPREPPERLLAIVDGSGSVGAQGYALASEFAAAATDLSANWEFLLMRGGQRPALLGDAFAQSNYDTSAQVREFLRRTPPLGATDLLTTFRKAVEQLPPGQPAQIVYVGDGIDTVSELSGPALVQMVAELFRGKDVRVSTVAVGPTYDREVLRGLAAALGGTFTRVESADNLYSGADQVLASFSRPLLRDVKVRFAGLDVRDVHPERLGTVFAGDTALVLGRVLKGGKGQVVFTANAEGKPVERTYAVDLAGDAQHARFVPRLWARAQIEALLGQMGLEGLEYDRKLRERIIEASVQYQIMSPFTAFLVLESEEDYRKYNIKRSLKRNDWRGDTEGLKAGLVAKEAGAKARELLGAFDLGGDLSGPVSSSRISGVSHHASREWGESNDLFFSESDAISATTAPSSGPASTIDAISTEEESEISKSESLNGKESNESLGDFSEVDAEDYRGLEEHKSKSQAWRSDQEFGYAYDDYSGTYGRQEHGARGWVSRERLSRLVPGEGFCLGRYPRYSPYSSLVFQGGKVLDLEVDAPPRTAAYYQRVLAKGPASPSTSLNLALALERDGRFTEALAALGPVVEKFPQTPELRLEQAALYYRAGDEKNGRAALAAAVAAAPGENRPALRERVAQILGGLNKQLECAQAWEELALEAATAEKAAAYATNAAGAYSGAQQIARGGELYAQLLKKFPASGHLLAAMGNWEINSRQDVSKGLELLRAAQKAGGVDVANALVPALWRSGAEAEAREVFGQALAAAKDAAAVNALFCSIYSQNRDESEREAFRLIEASTDPKLVQGAVQYVAAYNVGSQESDVKVVLKALARKDLPNSTRLHLVICLLNLRSRGLAGDLDPAQFALPEVADLRTPEELAQAASGLSALTNCRFYKEALALAEKLEQRPDFPENSRNVLANALWQALLGLDRKAEAQQRMMAFIATAKDAAQAQAAASAVFWHRLQQRDYEGAAQIAVEYAKRFPGSPYAAQFFHYLTQQAQQQLGREAYRKVMEKVAASYPDEPQFLVQRVQQKAGAGDLRGAAELLRRALKALEQLPPPADPQAAPPQSPAVPEATPKDPKAEEARKAREAQAHQAAVAERVRRLDQHASLIRTLATLSSQDTEMRAAFLKEAEANIPGEDAGRREWTEAVLACLQAAGETAAYGRRLAALAAAEPRDPFWSQRLAGWQWSSGKREEARKLFGQLSDADRDDVDLAFRLHEMCLFLKDAPAAESYFERGFAALARDPYRLQTFAQQYQYYNPRDPNSPEAQQERKRRLEWSLRAWQRLKQYPNYAQNGWADYSLGSVLDQLGRPKEESARAYLDALLADKSGASYAFSAKDNLVRLAQDEKARTVIVAQMRKLLEGRPSPAMAVAVHLFFHQIEKQQSHPEEARKELDAAVAIELDATISSNVGQQIMQALLAADPSRAEEYALKGGGKQTFESRNQLLRNLMNQTQDKALRLRLLRKLLEKPDYNQWYDARQAVELLSNDGQLDEAEALTRRIPRAVNYQWYANEAWSHLICAYSQRSDFTKALALLGEWRERVRGDNSGYRGNAFSTFNQVCQQALDGRALPAAEKDSLRKEVLLYGKDYFLAADPNFYWQNLNEKQLRPLDVSKELLQMAHEAATSRAPARMAAAAQFYIGYNNSPERIETARRLYREAAALDGADKPRLWGQLYNLYVGDYGAQNRQEWALALEVLEQLHLYRDTSYYYDHSYYQERARCLYGLDRKEEARAALRKALASPEFRRNYGWRVNHLANLAEQHKDWEMAAEVYEFGLRLYSRYATARQDFSEAYGVYSACANIYAQMGQDEKALDCYLRALSLVPRTHNQYRNLLDEALKRTLKGRTLDAAMSAYEKQVAAAGGAEKPQLRLAFAEACKQAGQTKKMLENLRIASGLLPKDMPLRQQVIDGYKKLNDYDAAIAVYLDWALVDPQNLDLYRGLGDLYAQLGRREDALAAWATMPQVRPREAEGYRAYAQKLVQVGRISEAAAALRKALRFRPALFALSQELADIYAKLGQRDRIAALWSDGETACRKSMADLPDDPAPWLDLGLFLHAQGRVAEEKALYQQILQRMWPRFQNETHPEARRRIERLRD